MSRIVMLRMDGEDQVEVKMSGDLTWMELSERFMQFLQGCGYKVSEEDIRDYFNELCGESNLSSDFDEELYSELSSMNTVTVSSYDKPEYNFNALHNVMNNWISK